MSDTSPLRISGLHKTYQKRGGGTLEAVRGISFDVRAGECFGLLGPNGAGKSTTIQCITGFYPATSGRVTVVGFDVNLKPKQARKALGVCSQEETLDSDFNVTDQLARHATFFRVSKRDALVRAARLLERFGLADKALEPIESLSGGMRRRLQVARALISEPKVLVLDEPTTGLDPDARRFVWEVLVEARAQGTAVLLSTHYMDEAERLCDRIAILHKGLILDIDSPEKLIAKHISTGLVNGLVEEEVRPGVVWKRAPNLEDVYLKVTGSRLGVEGL
jgi:lipooligosaccharide transport system ATP-binding protein